jgi:hypothetical protein
MVHRLLHPGVYRGLHAIDSLDEFAQLVGAPVDWEAKYNAAIALQNGVLLRNLNHFTGLPMDARESTIQSAFIALVGSLATNLGISITSDSEKAVIVGGILAHPEYDVHSRTDAFFLGPTMAPFLATEVKTNQTFPPQEMWYHGCRGVQVLSALYAYNCPTLLITQRQFKLFAENKERTAVFTYPYGTNARHSPHVNASLLQPMGTTLLKVVAICVLSSQEESQPQSSQGPKSPRTPPRKVVKDRHWNTIRKPLRKSPRLAEKQSNVSSAAKRTPTFISGYCEGKPVRSEIRVLSDDIVQAIESRIQTMEMEERLKRQPSGSTQSQDISKGV